MLFRSGRRRKDEKPVDRLVIRNSSDVYDYFYPILADQSIEEGHVLFVNQASKVLDSIRISVGGLTETTVDIRCVLREAFLRRATAMALCHNHPSGNIKPSRADDILTEKMKQACKAVNMPLVDHLIFADGSFYSYADEGKL